MAQTAPTKGALTAAKHSHALAETGYELMDRKRNILVREIMSLMDEAERLQSEIDDAFAEAYASMRLAEISTGGCAEEGAAGRPDRRQRLAALPLRDGSGAAVCLRGGERDFRPAVTAWRSRARTSTMHISNSRRSRGLIRDLAQTENCIYRLAYAIKKAQKRANALKKHSPPGLDADIARITDALEEKEREEFVRLKVIKNRNTG